MSDATAPSRRLWHLPLGLFRAAGALVIGTLLCLHPLGAIVAFGWITRKMRATITDRWGGEADGPGWVLGPRGQGWLVRLFGGLAANIRAGTISVLGLAIWTLPATLAWLGAWWAGWENSFNKGYEQAAVGPLVWAAATLILLPILAHLPLALAHAAHEDRLGAMFEVRRIRSLGIAGGWRLPALAFISVLGALPFLGLRVAPVFIEGIVPGFAATDAAGQAQVAQGLALLGAVAAFCAAAYLRWRAACLYAVAAVRAAGHPKFFLLWEDHPATQATSDRRRTGRGLSILWRLLACVIWLALPVMIVVGQFMNHSWALWLTHPVAGLPWWP